MEGQRDQVVGLRNFVGMVRYVYRAILERIYAVIGRFPGPEFFHDSLNLASGKFFWLLDSAWLRLTKNPCLLWHDSKVPYMKNTGAFTTETELHLRDQRLYVHNGVLGLSEGSTPVLMVTSPELIKRICGHREFKNFPTRRVFLCDHDQHDNMLPMTSGLQWARQKAALDNAFLTASKIDAWWSSFVDAAQVAVRELATSIAEPGYTDTDLLRFFSDFTMDVMARIIYGRLLDPETKANFVQHANIILSPNPEVLLQYEMDAEGASGKKLCVFNEESMEYFKNYTLTEMNRREQDDESHSDFLQQLLNAHIGNDATKKLTRDEVTAQCTIFLTVGFHSSASTLALTCFEIARHNDIKERVQEEIDALGEEFAFWSFREDNLVYLKNVVTETLRMYPPATRIERVCKESTRIGDITFTPGTVVFVPIWALHHDPEYFTDPEVFKPDRDWRALKDVNIAFGSGRRKCVAFDFAKKEIATMVAVILKTFKIQPSPRNTVLEMTTSRNITAPREVRAIFERKS